MRRIGLFSGIVAGGLVLASPALAGWGEDWGTMVWGAAPVGVPTLGLLGLGLLSLALAAAAVFSMRRRRPALGLSLTLVLLAIPLAVAAGTLSVPNTFVNGEVADADEVNANFDFVEIEVNDNDSRITAVESETSTAQTSADAAQSTADTAVTDAAAAQSTADAAAAGHTVDTTLDEVAVDHFVANNGYATGAHTVDTTLDEAAVDAFVANNGYAAASVQGPHDRPGLANTALGEYALLNNSPNGDYQSASFNTASGYDALESNTTGNWNTASGKGALYSNTTGSVNTAIGASSLYHNTTGNNNTASGAWALSSNTSGSANTASGYYALLSNIWGSSNTASGYYALLSNTGGSNNTASGGLALYSNTTGSKNTASGFQALYFNTTGSNNTASGFQTLDSNTEGGGNTASGFGALDSNTTGNNNTASGLGALDSNTTGSGNTASGAVALFFNTTGEENIALGYRAGYDTTGSNNILVGNEGFSGENGTIRIGTAGKHTATHIAGAVTLSDTTDATPAGAGAFRIGTGSTHLVFDGNEIMANSPSVNPKLHLQHDNEGKVVVGKSTATTATTILEVYGNAGKSNGGTTWSVISDRRLKKSIVPLEGALEDLLKLKGYTFEYIEGTPKLGRHEGRNTGFMAQEVEEVFPEWVFTDEQTGWKTISYSGFETRVVESLRALALRNEQLRAEKDAEITALRAEMEQRLAKVEELSGRLATLEARITIVTALAQGATVHKQ